MAGLNHGPLELLYPLQAEFASACDFSRACRAQLLDSLLSVCRQRKEYKDQWTRADREAKKTSRLSMDGTPAMCLRKLARGAHWIHKYRHSAQKWEYEGGHAELEVVMQNIGLYRGVVQNQTIARPGTTCPHQLVPPVHCMSCRHMGTDYKIIFC